MQHYSMLDLSPVPEGQTPAEALAQTVDLAQAAEAAGYHRFWLAEHHNMPGIASAATAVVIGQVAAHTSRIRVGAGGIMLPNHAPLVIAEQFGTLATLFPGRVDLGLGRAPGTDMGTARALRRNLQAGDTFPQDVVELIEYFDEAPLNAQIRAIPGEGTQVPVWILGSSLFGAQLAAYLGLPYAFASHFAPQALEDAIATYRETFRASRFLDKPHFMLAANVFAADTDEEGAYLRTSQQQAFANLRLGRPGRLPRPVRNIEEIVPAPYLASSNEALAVSATGSPETVRKQLGILVDRYRPDEVMVTGMIHDHVARKRSFAIAADALRDLVGIAQAA
ncbi:LLM class flavin-dependent oxidoreductase [Falsirhodobacter sp. 20TX0035]|uniref:LLM class flavin-dependent oxidoreductase n=1 Tax=Falsirhodobacter sp. 20TX0035 TaxID=3022019 RepID=UPI00232D1197|nr:LLM class flavin-dependent oxidoreductase [Falsirhodobacter sp. 20TX0035]MDB6453454.1 LLM class flavin-dependent oxidoreductase [Falsirhodobacter sp. 20TX0035]